MIFRTNILIAYRDAPPAITPALLRVRNEYTVAETLRPRNLTGKQLTTWEKLTLPNKEGIWRKE